jgi:uncharacterized protein
MNPARVRHFQALARVACLFALGAFISLGIASRACADSPDMNRPKIRTITAFVNLDPARYAEQVGAALGALQKMKAAFEKSGYDVQTLRITTQPFPEYTQKMSDEKALEFFRDYDQLITKDGLDASIGPAMSRAGGNPHEARLLEKILASTQILEGNVVIASTDGIHWDGIREAANVIHYLAENTPQSLGNFRFAAIAMVPPGVPFYPASYQVNEDHTFAVGLQSANVIAVALGSTHDPGRAQEAIEDSLGKWASEIQIIAKHAGSETGWTYSGIDLSPSPLKDISIGGAIEDFTGARLGSSGTLAAVAIVTRALANIPVKRTGYSGLMLPVLEDAVIAKRWSEGDLSLNSLLLYSSVCGTGLDVVPLAGETSTAQLEAILRDVASLAFKWHKPLSARLLPVKGKKAGETTDFRDPFLVNAVIQPVR